MTYLEDITTEELRKHLDRVDEKKPAQRLVAAINYKNGVSPTEIADWYGLSRKTVYNWLNRFDREPIERAVRDRSRPGRPSKLSGSQREQLRELLDKPPSSAGYHERTEWTPELLRRYLDERFGVEYTTRRARTLLGELGGDE